MSQKAEFYRVLGVLTDHAARGDRHALAVLDELCTLFRNVANAVEAGDQDHVDDLLTEAKARALLRSALG